MGCNPLGELSRPFVAYTGGVVPAQFYIDAAGAFVANYGGGVVPYVVLAPLGQYDLGAPDERVLIEGALRAVLVNVVPGANPPPRPVFNLASIGTVPPLKLRIWRENTPDYIYIDADSQITIPGGTFGIELIGPQGWSVDLGQPITGAGDPPFAAFLAEQRIRACLTCCPTPPSGRLTEVIPINTLSAVPRRSRRLHMYTQAGGTPQLDLVTVQGGGVAIMSTVQGNLGFSLGEQNVGSPTWVSPAVAGFDDLQVVWEVA
jgi:hypothetical protein